MSAEIPIHVFTPETAKEELARLAEVLDRANRAYHTHDAPDISDADYDTLKRRNAGIEAANEERWALIQKLEGMGVDFKNYDYQLP